MDQSFTEKWEPLRKAIQYILEDGGEGLRYEQLYTCGYNLVIRKQGRLLYSEVCKVVIHHLERKVRPAILFCTNDSFLRTLVQAWNDYQISMTRIKEILLYLERTDLNDNMGSVYNFGLHLFCDEVVLNIDIQDRLRDTVLQKVSRARVGEVVEWLLIENACQMLVELGIDSRSIYEEVFERRFLAESATFYALESIKHLTKKSAIDYVLMAEQCMKEESMRAKYFLGCGTEVKIQQVVYQELIVNHAKAIVEKEDSGVVAMLKNNRMRDLACVLRLLSHAETGLKSAALCGSKYLRELGCSLMEEDCYKKDSSSLVKKLMDLKDRFQHHLISCFNDRRYVKAIISANFKHILNVNSSSAEHVALYADDLLRSAINGKGKEETDRLLEEVAEFVGFLDEKDRFEDFYKQHMKERLLRNRSASDYAELAMVSKLKLVCSSAFTSKLEAILKRKFVCAGVFK